jgi:hypothetical protein
MLVATSCGLLLIGAGCSDSSEPSDQLPQVGRYHYTFDGLNTDLDPIHFQGTLVLDFVSEDSMAGTWDVPGYNPAVLQGGRLTDHWFLMATSPEEGVASHDVFPGDETLPVECSMTYNTGNGTRTLAADCTLERE